MPGQRRAQVCTVFIYCSPGVSQSNVRYGKDEPDLEDPEHMAAQAARYKHALLLLVDTIRKNHPSETIALIDAIRSTRTVPEAAEFLMQLSDLKNSPKTNNTEGSDGASSQ
ncbi:hypothetical protein BDW59DRAFT_157691 [Aspergillus cavernicola]|uniref:Uncharacterized protein n=1 Tax=Aspergillus cavernicola TaxID=176166 RepID=A0ABR4IVC5_9EURO